MATASVGSAASRPKPGSVRRGPGAAPASGEILIEDLSVCRPASALGGRYARGRWKLPSYERQTRRGVMLGAIAGSCSALMMAG